MTIQAASLTGVIRIVLIIAAIYFLVRILGRLLMPFMRDSTQRNGPDRNQRRDSREESRKEGDVRIEYTRKNERKQERKEGGDGEYIDFEELD